MRDFFARCEGEFKQIIDAARARLPRRVVEMTNPRFLCGVDPRFVGLHNSRLSDFPEYANVSGRDYDTLAHACFGAYYGQPTIVFPSLETYSDPVATIVHEWGHIFDEATLFQFDAPLSTPYSHTNRLERFAEAFETVLCPPSGAWADWTAAEDFRPLRDLMGIA